MTRPNRSPAREKPVVLLVNDQEWVVRSLETVLLAEGCTIQRAYTGRQALAKARECLPDLVILDSQLPDLSGPTICRQLRDDPAFGAALPVFITTAGSNGRERQLDALEAGATDFFMQPFDGQVLTLKVRNSLRARAAFDLARRAAMTDLTTTLYNREGLAARARELAALAARGDDPLACLVLAPSGSDLSDAAGQITDVAVGMGRALRNVLRSGDVIARTDLLEFTVLAPGADGDGASRMVGRIEGALADAGLSTGVLPLRAGIVVGSPSPDGEALADDLLARAAEAIAPPPVATRD